MVSTNPSQYSAPSGDENSGEDATSDGDIPDPGLPVVVQTRRPIIVEPVLALFFTAFIPCNALISQFVYALVSTRNNLTQALDKYGGLNGSLECVDEAQPYIYHLQQHVQSKSADLLLVLNAASSIPAVVMVILYGAYSDRASRKLPMVTPILGQLVKCVVYILTIQYRLPLYLLVIGNVVEGLSGGIATMAMACFAYLTNIIEPSSRTVRITAIEVTCGLCTAVGQVAMGLAISHLGYMWPFLFVIAVHLINLGYLVVFVPEIRRRKLGEDSRLTGAQITSGLKLFTQNDEAGTAWQRWLLLAAALCCNTVTVGRWDPITLFCLNSPLCWSSVLIGGYVAWTALSATFGEIGLVALLYKKIHDTGLVVLGCVSGCIYFILLAFCNTTWAMFLVAPVGLGSFIPGAMLRSLSSKLTPPDRQGALFSVLAISDTVCNLTGSIMFNPIYGATLFFMKGFVFLVMAGLQCLGMCLTIIYALKSERKPEVPAPVSDESSSVGYEAIN